MIADSIALPETPTTLEANHVRHIFFDLPALKEKTGKGKKLAFPTAFAATEPAFSQRCLNI
jgi:hypothetical protein